MTADELRARVRELMPRARADLSRLVEIPSVADPQQAPLERCREAAELTRALLADAGLEGCRLIELPGGTPPAVFGERPGPPGAPTVLLYAHYDVQPAGPQDAWDTPPFALTGRDDGRWYGRGAADDKGNLVAHLTALRALGEGVPVGVKAIVEGAEEQGGGAFEPWLAHEGAHLVAADAVVVADAGNFAVGMPTITTTLRGVVDVVVTVRALRSAMHSGMFGGPAPDALVALIALLATLHDERGNPTVRGVAADGRWPGVQYPPERYRRDATVLDGAELIGDGSVSDALWARPWVSVLGIDCPPVAGSAPALQPEAAARVSLRIPPGTDPEAAARALTDHLRGAAPWGVEVDVERRSVAAPFAAGGDGPAFRALAGALAEAYGREATTAGQGASIPLCTTLQEHLEGAEILLIGVEEPRCLIHAPNESVDPGELEHIALAEALFLQRLGSGSQ